MYSIFYVLNDVVVTYKLISLNFSLAITISHVNIGGH